MYFNKWIQFALSVVIVITGAMAGFDWTPFFSAPTVAKIAGFIGFVKFITNALAPSANTMVNPTGGGVIAQAAPDNGART